MTESTFDRRDEEVQRSPSPGQFGFIRQKAAAPRGNFTPLPGESARLRHNASGQVEDALLRLQNEVRLPRERWHVAHPRFPLRHNFYPPLHARKPHPPPP